MKIFIYEVGHVNGRIRANGLLLVAGRVNDWHHANYERNFTMHVLGQSVTTTLAVTTTDSTDWVETDPDKLTAEAEYLSSAQIEHKMQLMQLRPRVMFDVDVNLTACELPVVLSEKQEGAPRIYSVEFESHVFAIDELPEISDFVQRELADAEDDPFDMLAVKHLKDATNLPLPDNTWLPCKLEDETDCVYRITSSEGRFRILELWVLGGDGNLCMGTKLMSRCGDDPFEIGRVLSVSEISSVSPPA